MSVRPTLDSERDILDEALSQLTARLPTSWSFVRGDETIFGPDATITLRSPSGDETALVIEVKRSLVTKELPAIREQLKNYIDQGNYSKTRRRGTAVPVVVSRYISAPLQAWMTERDLSYADATGNLRLVVDKPALFVRDVGADKDPWRGPGRPKGNLTGAPAARVVRALVDYSPPYSVPTLITKAGTSSGATYRVVQYLEDQALINRTAGGAVENVEWRQLLERWSSDYGFSRTNSVTPYLAPRGLDDVMKKLAKVNPEDVSYAVTGTIAAEQWAPYAPARNAMIYTDAPATLANIAALREVDAGANVLLAKPHFDVVFERTTTSKRIVRVAPSQAVVDLMTGPGRNPSEAEELLKWMEAHEGAWRQ